MPNRINLVGTSGKEYNLDKLKNEDTRSDSSKELVVQIWYWNPNLPAPHNEPNPKDPVIGQIWLSKLAKEDSVEYRELMAKDGK